MAAQPAPKWKSKGEQIAIDADGVASALQDAESVVIIPGYGMAVAQAQQNVAELTRRLRAKVKQLGLRFILSLAGFRVT